METNFNLMVGRTVVYTVSKSQTSKGKIMDRIEMKDKKDDIVTVSAYMIQDIYSNELISVQHWRVKNIIEDPNTASV